MYYTVNVNVTAECGDIEKLVDLGGGFKQKLALGALNNVSGSSGIKNMIRKAIASAAGVIAGRFIPKETGIKTKIDIGEITNLGEGKYRFNAGVVIDDLDIGKILTAIEEGTLKVTDDYDFNIVIKRAVTALKSRIGSTRLADTVSDILALDPVIWTRIVEKVLAGKLDSLGTDISVKVNRLNMKEKDII